MTKVDGLAYGRGNSVVPRLPQFWDSSGFKLAMVELGKQPHELCVVSGIGQAAKFPHYVKANFFQRPARPCPPGRLGHSCSQSGAHHIVMTGEGDCYGEGGNHFIHTVRRNPT